MRCDIRAATAADAYLLSVLTGELLQEIMERIGKELFRFDLEATEMRAKELIGRNLYAAFLATEPANGGAIGFISLYESYALYAEGAYGTIPELYVRPEQRSQGVGHALLAQAKAYADSRGWKRLEVTTPPLPQFERSLAFYESNGFEISGGRKLKTDIAEA